MALGIARRFDNEHACQRGDRRAARRDATRGTAVGDAGDAGVRESHAVLRGAGRVDEQRRALGAEGRAREAQLELLDWLLGLVSLFQ